MMLRDEAGKLNGVLLEKAMFLLLAKLPQPTAEQKLAALDAAQNAYFAEGYTHAQDGATQPRRRRVPHVARGARAAEDRPRAPPLLARPRRIARQSQTSNSASYRDHVKLQGIKFVLDGSVQARTGYFTRDYARGSPEGTHPWHGQPVLSEEQFIAQAKKANDRHWQLFVHANGDAAIDMAIRGFDALGIKADDDRRPVVIHSQFQRPDQLAAYKRIGVGPSYFSNHTWYWADVHRTNFPKEVVDFISPLRSAKRAGLIPSNHSDYSVTPLDTRFMLWTSMARVSPTGVVSGPDERLGAYEALQALTTGPARQAFEEDRKGRIKAGLLADFVILDKIRWRRLSRASAIFACSKRSRTGEACGAPPADASNLHGIEQLVHLRSVAVEIMDRRRDEADEIELAVHHRRLGDPLARQLVALDRISEGKAHRIVPAHLVGFDLVDFEQRRLQRGARRGFVKFHDIGQQHRLAELG
jgi:predicted amidohydrolase YtcJ